MKKRIIGLVLSLAFVISASVGFAYNGPPTTPCDYDTFDKVSTKVTISQTAVEVKVNLGQYEATMIVDVGKTYDSAIYDKVNEDFEINTYALATKFTWTPLKQVKWRHYNEWLMYKYELTFTSPYEQINREYYTSRTSRTKC